MEIAIFGDAHLNYKQYNLEQREIDIMNALKDIVKTWTAYTTITKPPILISAGDLFNNSRPTGESVYQAQQILSGTEFYGIDGNHDISNNTWLQLCGGTSLHKNIVEFDGVNICGLNWVRPHIFLETLQDFVKTVNKPIDIFILHQLIDEFLPFKQLQLPVAEIARILKPSGVKAVIMGDAHLAVDNVVDGILFAYTGSIEKLAADEQDDKSYIILDTNTMTIKRHPIKTRPFERLFIQTEEDVTQIYNDQDKFYILEYDVNNKEIATVARRILVNDNLYRLAPITSKVVNNVIVETAEGYERVNAIKYLQQSVEKFFERESVEFGLINEILAAPENLDTIILNYGRDNNLIHGD